MDNTVKKKQVGFRLSEDLVDSIEYLASQYPRFSLTDFVDMALKTFVMHSSDLDSSEAHKKATAWLNENIGKYMKGEHDSYVRAFHWRNVKTWKRKQSKEPSP